MSGTQTVTLVVTPPDPEVVTVQREIVEVRLGPIAGPPGPPGGGGGGGTVDSVARAAITSHTEETTAAHGGIVASDDSRLSDARTPTAHTHPWSDITDAPSPGSPVWGGIGGTLSDQIDLDSALAGKVDDTDPRVPPTPVGQANGRMLAVAGNAWTLVDAPSGGGAALPSIVPVGTYASQPGPYTTGSSTLIAEGRATWSALWVPAGTWDAIGIWVTTTTAAVLRLCLDTMSATTGLPTALVSDAGTVDCSTATGLRLVTFAAPVVQATPGWMWGRVVLTNATAPTLAILNAAGGCMWPPGIGDGGSFTNRAVSGLVGAIQATGAGEQPAPGSYALASASTPRVWLRRSA